jgi:transmembrane sensor
LTAERETSRSIDECAADWIARLDRGPLSEDESKAFEAWLNGDPRRRGALLRADAMAMLSESARALGPRFDPKQFVDAEPAPEPSPRKVSRRKLLTLVGTGGAVVASIAALGFSLPAAAITTGLGEARLVTLEDGSTVMLNTQTSVRIDYGAHERRVELLYGEAFFTILRDPARPFVLDVTDTRLRADRATFRVRKLDDKPLDILVDQGDLALAGAALPKPLMLPASTRLVVPPRLAAEPAPQPIGADLLTRELAWREGKIAFEGETLGQAATEFARYSKTRIEIRDPALAREPVAGLFAASDPVGFARASARLFDAEIEQRGDVVLLSRGVRRP